VVASALLHALWNALLKRQPDPEGAAMAILGTAMAAAWMAWPLAGQPGFPSREGLWWTLAAGLCEAGYFVTLALALRDAPLGIVYTVSRGGALAAVWPASALWLGEAISGRALAGAAVVGAGLVLVGAERREAAAARGVLWALACAGFIAAYHILYKAALATGAAPAAVFAVSLTVAWPLNLARLGRGGLVRAGTALRASPRVVLMAGLLCTGSFLLFLLALVRGGAGAAGTLRNVAIVFALGFAWLMGERPGRRQLAGTAVVLLGAVLLAWPTRPS
jgi:drug/metabolite transporter (DMT)-like permease